MITAAVHLGLLLIVLVLSHLHNLFFHLFSLFFLRFLPLFPSHCYTSLDGDLNLLNLGLIAFALGNEGEGNLVIRLGLLLGLLLGLDVRNKQFFTSVLAHHWVRLLALPYGLGALLDKRVELIFKGLHLQLLILAQYPLPLFLDQIDLLPFLGGPVLLLLIVLFSIRGVLIILTFPCLIPIVLSVVIILIVIKLVDIIAAPVFLIQSKNLHDVLPVGLSLFYGGAGLVGLLKRLELDELSSQTVEGIQDHKLQVHQHIGLREYIPLEVHEEPVHDLLSLSSVEEPAK